MRFAIALSLIATAFLLAPGVATAAPFALSNHAIASQNLSDSAVEQVARRTTKTRKKTRKYRCSGKCKKRPWYPYQYRYWKYYLPFGGPFI